MSDEQTRILVNNAMKYFEIYTSQRIQVLNFFIVFESLFVTGVMAIISTEANPVAGLIISFAISFFAVCFYWMDQRRRYMIKAAENVIMTLEKSLSESQDQCVFRYAENYLSQLKQSRNIKLLSWSKSQKMIYAFFFICGLLGIALFTFFTIVYYCNGVLYY